MANEDEGFTVLLHETGGRIAAPYGAALYDGAVRRGLRLKRRRALGAWASGLVSVGAAGALAFALLPGSAARPGLAAANSPSAVHIVSVKPPAPSLVTGTEMLRTFSAALPASADVLQNPKGGSGPGATKEPYVNMLSGYWEESVNASLKSSGPTGWSAVSFAVERGVQTTTCKQAEAGSTTDTCTVTALAGGTLILDKTRHNPAESSSDPIWQYFWYSPAGYESMIDIGDGSAADFALTEQQAEAMLTDQVWAPLAARLPTGPVCRGGTLTMALGSISKVVCSTDGKTYPED